MSESQILAEYLHSLESQLSSRGRRVAPATVRAARSDLRAFITWWEGVHALTFDPALVLETDLDDYSIHRQRHDGRAPATINRGNASLRSFFAWAVQQGRITVSPAHRLRDLSIEEIAPRGLDLDGVEWLIRAAMLTADPLERARDLALLTLLSDCGLRSQEAADLELRDVDLEGGLVTVRMGKGRKPRRVLLNVEGPTIDRLRDYITLMYPASGAVIATPAEEIERGTVKFLAAQRLTKAGQPWEPGMQTVTMRKRLIVLRSIAIELIREQIAREQRLERIEGLVDTIQDLETCSPHVLRHGLAYRLYAAGATAKTVARQFGHSRETTAMKYGKQKDKELRQLMGRANRRQG
jgi:site-specific recombinase XerD